MLENKHIKNTLIAMLGNKRFSFLKRNFSVENPIDIKDNLLTATACQQHNCSDTNFIVIVDISNGKVYAGIRENGVVKTYPSNVEKPIQLVAWLNN